MNYTEVIRINTIELDNAVVEMEAACLINEELCQDNCFIPFKADEKKLYIAACEPPLQSVMDEVKFLTGKEVILYKASRDQIISAINSCFSRKNAESALKSLKSEAEDKALENNRAEDDRDSPVKRLASSIILKAICSNASDIHIEPFRKMLRVRYRIDGMLFEQMNVPISIYPMICTRIKVMAGLNITEKRVPQDGKINFRYNSQDYDFRVSTVPALYGEKIVIRILYGERNNIKLNQLGFDIMGVEFIKGMLNSPHGIILVTGPTGSGKSTTLYSMINSLNRDEKNIVTIEDPVEFSLEGINQINVNHKTGMTFAKGLRSILRQDPDVIMIGEIRDEETAQIAVRAAITGHLVISTLHTNDSSSAVLRLMDMGVPSYLACDALIGTVAQRLVRKICPYCKEEISISEFQGINTVYKGRGCTKCSGTGYKGRTVIYEYNKMDAARKLFIQGTNNVEDIRRYNVDTGMKTLEENCRELVISGVTTLEEYQKISLQV